MSIPHFKFATSAMKMRLTLLLVVCLMFTAGCPNGSENPPANLGKADSAEASEGSEDPTEGEGEQPAVETPVAEPLDADARKKFIAEMRELGVSVELNEQDQIISLVMGFTKLDDERLANLPPLPHLTFLGLDHTNITDAGLKSLADRTSLQVLYLGGNKLTGDGLKHISGLKNLGYLDLSDLPIEDGALDSLASLKSLKELNLTYTQVTLEGAIGFAKGLPELEVSGPFGKLIGGRRLTMDPGVEDANLAKLQQLPSLRELNLWECDSITDEGIAHIAALTQLTTLELGYVQITDAGLAKLAALENLRQLDIRETETSVAAALKLVAELPKLNVLADWGKVEGATRLVFQPETTDAQLADLKHLPALESLTLWRCDQLTDDAMAHVVGCENLKQLNIGATNIGDAGIAELKGLENLERLVLANTSITDASLENIAKLSSLVDLDLSSTAITDEGINALHPRSDIEVLNLARTSITDAVLPKLGPLQSLTSLDLSETSVGAGAGALVNLGRLPKLQKVDLSLTLTSDDELAYLAKCQNLREIELWGTPITDDGLKYLSGMKQVTRFGLFGTPVSEEAVAALREALPDAEVEIGFKSAVETSAP